MSPTNTVAYVKPSRNTIQKSGIATFDSGSGVPTMPATMVSTRHASATARSTRSKARATATTRARAGTGHDEVAAPASALLMKYPTIANVTRSVAPQPYTYSQNGTGSRYGS